MDLTTLYWFFRSGLVDDKSLEHYGVGVATNKVWMRLQDFVPKMPGCQNNWEKFKCGLSFPDG